MFFKQAGKGLLFLTYQVLTENVRVCKRFASTKANKILNIIETLAWPAACGVTVYGIMQFCIGISCTLSWVMVPLTAILAYVPTVPLKVCTQMRTNYGNSVISGFSAWISIKEHARYKATGQKPGDSKSTNLSHVMPWQILIHVLSQWSWKL